MLHHAPGFASCMYSKCHVYQVPVACMHILNTCSLHGNGLTDASIPLLITLVQTNKNLKRLGLCDKYVL